MLLEADVLAGDVPIFASAADVAGSSADDVVQEGAMLMLLKVI